MKKLFGFAEFRYHLPGQEDDPGYDPEDDDGASTSSTTPSGGDLREVPEGECGTSWVNQPYCLSVGFFLLSLRNDW